jgi:3-oxoacyl-[acyl-carrier protein] reductase
VDEFSLSISMRRMPMFSAGLPDLEERATLPGQQPQGHGIVQLDLSDKTALVTGASAGIGAVIVCCLAREGVRPAITTGREEALRALAAEIEAEAPLQSPLSRRISPTQGGLDRIVAEAGNGLGQMDILINCAGASRPASLESERIVG